MGMYDQEQKEVLNCAKWLSEHGYFGGFRGSGGNISVKSKEGEGTTFIITLPIRIEEGRKGNEGPIGG